MKRKPEATLNDLEAYIGSLGEEPLRLIERELKSWGELSYEELITLIEQGRLNDFPDWQEKYSELINDVLSPLWMGAAMVAASAKATKKKVVLSDSMDDVKAWLTNHGGELITRLSDESRRAVVNVLLMWQEQMMNPRRMAQQIRPLIGLNAKQAEANANYRERLYQRYRDGGLNPTKAAAKADAAALRYASKQHRYRAETIVHTELAYAYNNGQDIGIRRAIAGNFIGKCELVWRTAGTNRVCGRCMELKDKVIGTTDEQGATLPPLHPRCRCVIEYREVEAPK